MARYSTFINQVARQWLVPVHRDRLACIYDPAVAFQRVAHVHLPFFHAHDRRLIVFIHAYVKSCTAYRNYRRWRVNLVRIGLIAPLFDVDFYASNEHVKQIAQIRRVFPKHDIGVRINLKSAPIGNLKLGEAVWTGNDHLPHLDGVADAERPRVGVVQHGNPASDSDDRGSLFWSGRKELGPRHTTG